MAKFGDVICSSTNEYSVKRIVGSGGFGTVVFCKKKNTTDLVALKIVRKAKDMAATKYEADIMKLMRGRSSQNFNIVMCADSFMAGNLFYMEFERLHMSIRDYLKRKSFSLKEIRPFLQQMSVALQFLGSIGLVHADLKPENIMLVDHRREPLRFKLIDFGLAHPVPETRTGRVCGTLPYIAPEMLLGADYTNAIDTWALGCTAVEMLSRETLLPGSHPAEVLGLIVSLLGFLPKTFLNNGCYTKQYFIMDVTPDLQDFTWCLKQPLMLSGVTSFKSVMERLMVRTETTGEAAYAERLDQMTFVDLMAKIINGHQRITPSGILRHPFLTLSHLDSDYSSYRQESVSIMRVCPNWRAHEQSNAPPRCAITSNSERSSRQPPTPQSSSSGRTRPLDSEINPGGSGTEAVPPSTLFCIVFHSLMLMSLCFSLFW